MKKIQFCKHAVFLDVECSKCLNEKHMCPVRYMNNKIHQLTETNSDLRLDLEGEGYKLKEACIIITTDNRPIAQRFEEKYPKLFKGLT